MNSQSIGDRVSEKIKIRKNDEVSVLLLGLNLKTKFLLI